MLSYLENCGHEWPLIGQLHIWPVQSMCLPLLWNNYLLYDLLTASARLDAFVSAEAVSIPDIQARLQMKWGDLS